MLKFQHANLITQMLKCQHFSLLHVNCIFRNTVSKSGRAAAFTLGKQCLRLYKLDEQGDFRFKLSELRVLPLIDDFALPLCERSGDVANRNIVVILSGSTYGYIRRYNVPAFSEAGIESIRFRSISKRNFFCKGLLTNACSSVIM